MERAAEVEVDTGVAGGGSDLPHADPVNLGAGEVGVGVERVGAGSADVRACPVVEPKRALVAALVAAFVVEVEARAPMRENIPPTREGEAAIVLAAALPELLDLGVQRVESESEARMERLVEIEGVALRAE